MLNDFKPRHPDITEDMWMKIDEIITKNRPKPGSVITVLRECQNTVGYLPVELIDYISYGLNIPSSRVFGVATFYSLFSLEPKGRHTVRVCMGTACYVKGIKEIVNRISNKYQVREGGTTKDKRFSLEAVRCVGSCGLAPVAVVDEDIYGDTSPRGIIEILEKYE
ncbi:MAG: NAD(P)H-dependent oxidoreductase subunit E [Desulfobacteraceae bacterium]|nr:NAD(P)H-dependent oxidoreductase subunit E [Desulfobacteraceae bacterium]MCP4345886.1 NAD(P)H-dependent oxidoreductase subunit E [Desulfobacterales bacterium]